MTAVEFLEMSINPFKDLPFEKIPHIKTFIKLAKEIEYKQNMNAMQRGMELQKKENNRIGFRERNGLIHSQTEISDEEIEKAWDSYKLECLEKFMKDTMIADYAITNKETFAKWYREQLKKKQ